MNWFGPTGKGFFDVWSLVHLAFWFVAGANLEVLRVPHWIRWPAIVAAALLWEVLEANWFYRWVQHREAWYNSWVSDILMAVIGVLVGMLVIRKQ